MTKGRPTLRKANIHPHLVRVDPARPRPREDGDGAGTHSIVGDLQLSPRALDTASANPSDDVFVERRPWGRFEQLVSNTQVTVKIIAVEPGQRLSLQRHDRRGELWRILDVPMEVVVDDRQWTAQPGDTVWAPRGAVHRLGNPGTRSGRVLEVAFGRFDEDDIERLADDYAR